MYNSAQGIRSQGEALTAATTPYHLPDDRYYDGTYHMWAQWHPATGQVIVGMDALGLAALGDLAYIALPAVGTVVKRHEPMGTLEASKMTGELMAPVSGLVVAHNERVLREPLLVNRDPYGQGWLVALRATNWEAEAAALISGEALLAWVAAEIARCRAEGWIEECTGD